MNHSYGLIVESLVAVMLLVMFGYCVMLDLRLKRLKAGEQSLRAKINELIAATEIDDNLGKQIAAATKLTGKLTDQLCEGESVIQRLSKIVIAARPPQEVHRPSSARAIAAAAQAFSERIRSDGLAA